MCRPEVAKGTCVIITFFNIVCAVYYVLYFRPAADVAALEHRAALRDVESRASHSTLQEALDLGVSHDDSKVLLRVTGGGNVTEALKCRYIEQHGIRCGVNGNSAPALSARLWWEVRSTRSGSADIDVSEVAVPFAGGMWLPWLSRASRTPPHVETLESDAQVNEQASSLLLPPSLWPSATLNGTVPLVYHVHNPTPAAAQRSRSFSKKHLIDILQLVYRMAETPSYSAETRSAVMQRSFVLSVQHAKAAHIAGRDVLVYGTLRQPTLEVTLLAIGGAARVISVDVHPFNVTDCRIVSITPREFWSCRGSVVSERCAALRLPMHYSVIVAYSTIQHGGLGRYGDALDMFGDVKLIWALRGVMPAADPSAILMLGVPLGNDCLVFNKHRVYGRRRLPLLLVGFDVVSTSGFDSPVGTHPSGSTVLLNEGSGEGSGTKRSLSTTFSKTWAVDSRCSGGAQRIPLIVLSRRNLVLMPHTTSWNTSSYALVDVDAVKTWHRIPGLAGPYPVYR